MSFSWAFQWYHFHLDPIWPDGTFKVFFLASLLFCFIWYSARFFSVVFADLSAPEWQQWKKWNDQLIGEILSALSSKSDFFFLVKLCSCDEQVLFVQNKTSKSINLHLYKRELLWSKLETNTVVSEIIMCWSCFACWGDGRITEYTYRLCTRFWIDLLDTDCWRARNCDDVNRN